MSDFKKLDDLPKGRPNSYEEVMKAMSVLHKLLLKQSEAYGGKNSKYIPAQVVEGSLLKSFANEETELFEGSEVDRLLGIAHDRAEALSDHLKSKDDEKAMRLLGSLLRMIGAAMGANHDDK